jgi:glycosyltransferase involved in cell wall biosynthesis
MADALSHVRFEGVIPMASVPTLLEAVDILIQPSHTTDDGWGVIVSEALLCGAAAITSDVVGASICLDDPIRGRTVPPRRPAAIAQAIADLIESDALRHERRIERHAWASRNLVADVGAAFLMAKLRTAVETGAR